MPRHPAYVLAPTLVIAALLPSWSAAAADAAIAVLGVEAAEGAPETLASAITDAMRQRVSSGKGFRLVPGRDLVEVKLVFSCPDEAPSCMAQAGKSLGAAKLIFGSVKKSAGDNYVVTLKLLDTARGVVDAWVAEQINKAQANAAGVRAPVQKWFASLTGQGGAGIIRVRGDVIGASVSLDGNPVGTVGTDDLILPGVTAGKHQVTVTKPGYNAVEREVTVASGETAPLEVGMSKSAVAAALERNKPQVPSPDAPAGTATNPAATVVARPAPPRRSGDEGDRTALKVASFGVLGAGVVGIVTGVAFGIQVQKINSNLDEYRRYSCMKSATNPAGICDAQGHPAKPLRKDEQDYVNQEKDEGKRQETYQYISYGVGGALLVVSGYLFYRAYLADDGAESASAPSPRLAITPFFTPTSSGLSAAFRF